MTYGNSSVYSTFESAEDVENFHSSATQHKRTVGGRPGIFYQTLGRLSIWMTWIAKDRRGIWAKKI